jgi:hypothetical protein
MMELIMRLVIAALCVSLPAFAWAQENPEVKPEKMYNAIALASWKTPDGKKHAVVSYAESPDETRAEDLALKGCFAKGAQQCQSKGPWDEGCVYATVYTDSKGDRFWKTSEKEQELFAKARETGRKMDKPIGGCVNN